MMQQQPIQMFGDGSTRRDYTYVADIVQGVLHALHYEQNDFEIFNLGNSRTISLQEMIETMQDIFQVKAIIEQKPEQPGDVPQTFADIEKASRLLGYKPLTPFRDGLVHFKDWFMQQKNP
jgi:UDP-glucuronate 4-epimerase